MPSSKGKRRLKCSGITGILAWLVVLGDFGGIFFGISSLVTLIWLVALGFWLLTRGEEQAEARAATA